MADLVFPSAWPIIDVSYSGLVSMPTNTVTVIHSKAFESGMYCIDASMSFYFSASPAALTTGSGIWKAAISLTTGFDTTDNVDLSVSIIDNRPITNMNPLGNPNAQIWRCGLKRYVTLSASQTIYIVAQYPITYSGGALQGIAQMIATKY